MLAFLKSLVPEQSVLTPEEFLSRRQEADVLFDVRSRVEYANGHLAGAEHLDVMSPAFAARVDALDRDKTYYLYCRAGHHSGQAARRMREMGFAHVHCVGGFEALARAGVPIASEAYALV